MSKADFEFYEIPGVEGEFVRPAQASDPYAALIHPREAAGLAINSILAPIVNRTGIWPELEIEPAHSDDLKGYFFKTLASEERGALVGQKLRFTLQLPKEEGYYSELMNEVAEIVHRAWRIDLAPKPAEGSKNIDGLTLKRELGGAFTVASLYDDNDQPKDVRYTLDQAVPLRVYRWLPGPVRTSRQSTNKLPPTYSPRPSTVILAQTVEIIGLNPLVADRATE